MDTSDAFELLGIARDSTVDDVRAARRRLAKDHHPDRGGDPEQMRMINQAADSALRAVGADPTMADDDAAADSAGARGPETSERPADTGAGRRTGDGRTGDGRTGRGRTGDDGERMVRDTPSFTVEALPVDCFEALLIVASWLGEVLDDDPPYRLDTYLYDPFDCWCRLEVVPDAGGSTVSLAIAGIDGASTPDVIAVRDTWITNLNLVDWP